MPDICDVYANQAIDGLGPGGYRVGSVPPNPAHPNCLCTLVAIIDDDHFARELAQARGEPEPPRPWEDERQVTASQWLESQPEAMQKAILGTGRHAAWQRDPGSVVGPRGALEPLWKAEGRQRPTRVGGPRRSARSADPFGEAGSRQPRGGGGGGVPGGSGPQGGGPQGGGGAPRAAVSAGHRPASPAPPPAPPVPASPPVRASTPPRASAPSEPNRRARRAEEASARAAEARTTEPNPLPTEPIVPITPEETIATLEHEHGFSPAQHGPEYTAAGARAIERVFPRGVDPADLSAVMQPPPGLELRNAEWGYERHRLVLMAGFHRPDGARVGVLTRAFTRGRDGALVAVHERMMFTEAEQEMGHATTILRNELQAYERMGVARIEMRAAWDGRYVWPRLGFDWDGGLDGEEARSVIDGFRHYLRVGLGMSAAQADVEIAKIRSADDLASFVVRFRGERIRAGWEFLTAEPNSSDATRYTPLGVAYRVDLTNPVALARIRHATQQRPSRGPAAPPSASAPRAPRAGRWGGTGGVLD